MNTSGQSTQVQGISLLATLLKVQALAFLIYGLTFFLIPAWTLQTFFGFDKLPTLIFPRVVGAVFLAIVLAEYFCIRRLSERLEFAWFFTLVPFLMFIAFIWERAAGTYEGTAFFYWSSFFVTLFFTVVIGVCRIRVKRP